jgi:hypothetical protein
MAARTTFLLVAHLLSVSAAAQAPLRHAEPLEPISVILSAFQSSPVVAVPDAHRHDVLHRLNLALVRDPRFPHSANDIVVEFGNALHQAVVDRFLGGQEVPYDELRRVWMDTTQAHPVWDTPHAEEFFRTVRAINAALPPERRLRVLLGDPAIDWTAIKSRADHLKWIAKRETFPAELIRREVLAKGRRALLLYGVMHLQRKNAMANFDATGPAASLVSLLEESGETKVFSIGLTFELSQLQPNTANWPAPSLALLRGTIMGAADVPYDGPRFTIRDGKPVPIGRAEWKTIHMEGQFDALLYLGPRAAIIDARVAPALCSDPQYYDMRTRRMALAGWLEPLKEYCGDVGPK